MRDRKSMSYIAKYLSGVAQIIERLDTTAIEKTVDIIVDTRARGGRLFILGVGGGGGTCLTCCV